MCSNAAVVFFEPEKASINPISLLVYLEKVLSHNITVSEFHKLNVFNTNSFRLRRTDTKVSGSI